MKVWELMAKLEEAKAGSVIGLCLPSSATKKQIEERGLDITSADNDEDSGVVTLYATLG